jgi:hypothetical protein
MTLSLQFEFGAIEVETPYRSITRPSENPPRQVHWRFSHHWRNTDAGEHVRLRVQAGSDFGERWAAFRQAELSAMHGNAMLSPTPQTPCSVV